MCCVDTRRVSANGGGGVQVRHKHLATQQTTHNFPPHYSVSQKDRQILLLCRDENPGVHQPGSALNPTPNPKSNLACNAAKPRERPPTTRTGDVKTSSATEIARPARWPSQSAFSGRRFAKKLSCTGTACGNQGAAARRARTLWSCARTLWSCA